MSMDKESLLKIAKRILNAPNETIDILIKSPICNLKTIQRSAKNLKDPDPLSSMTATINTKYPISVDSEKAEGIPEELMGPVDTHQFGRRICSLKAIDWWIENHKWSSEEHKKETEKTVDVLYKAKRNDVQTYFSYEWKNAQIIMGPTYLQRKMIATNKITVNIPKEDRNAALLLCLAPEFTLNYGNINTSQIKALEELRDLSLTSKMTMASQLRILLNEMDPKFRTIPIMPERSDYENRFRHAFSNSNVQVIAKTSNVEAKNEIEIDHLNRIGKAVWKLIKEGKTHHQLQQYIKDVKIDGVNITKVAYSHQQSSDPYVKALLSILDIETYNMSSSNKMNFNPEKSDVQKIGARTVKGVPFSIYTGLEIVNFEYLGVGGSFTHNAEHFKSMGMVRTSKEILSHIIAEIAVYCRIGFYASMMKTHKRVVNEIYKKYKTQPELLLECEKKDVLRWVVKGGKAGKLTEIMDVQPINLHKERAVVELNTEDQVVLRYSSGQESLLHPCQDPVLPSGIKGIRGPFEKYLTPSERLLRLILRYSSADNYSELLNKIRNNDFDWGNSTIKKDINPTIKDRVCFSAATILKSMKLEDIRRYMISFLYCFAGETRNSVPLIQFFDWNGITISFTMAPGSYYTMTNGKEYLNNLEMTNLGLGGGNYMQTLIPGYRIEVVEKSNLPITNLHEVYNSEAKKGSKYQLLFEGKILEITKDPSFDMEIEDTMARHLNVISIDDIFQSLEEKGVSIKRKAMPLEPTTSKVSRLDEEYWDVDDL